MKKLLLFFSLLALAWADARELVDMAGRTIVLEAPVERVATVGGTPALNAFIFAMGKAGTIRNGVGDSPFRKMPFWKHQAYFLPEIFTLPQVSSNPPEWLPDFEAIARMHPDIALVNNAAAAELLERRGVKAAVMTWKGPQSVKKSIDFLGELFDERAKAEAYDAYYDAAIARVSRAMQGYGGPRKSAVYLRLEPLSMPMVSTANYLFEKAGAATPASEVKAEHATIGLEKLMAWNPDVLFVWSKKDKKVAYEDQRFADLKAVRDKQVYVIPMGAHLWTHYTPEQPLAILWCAKTLYPERFKSLDMKEEARRFYATFMQKRLSDAQLASILGRE